MDRRSERSHAALWMVPDLRTAPHAFTPSIRRPQVLGQLAEHRAAAVTIELPTPSTANQHRSPDLFMISETTTPELLTAVFRSRVRRDGRPPPPKRNARGRHPSRAPLPTALTRRCGWCRTCGRRIAPAAASIRRPQVLGQLAEDRSHGCRDRVAHTLHSQLTPFSDLFYMFGNPHPASRRRSWQMPPSCHVMDNAASFAHRCAGVERGRPEERVVDGAMPSPSRIWVTPDQCWWIASDRGRATPPATIWKRCRHARRWTVT